MEDRNKDVYLNFGLIVRGSLRSIEKLQRIVSKDCEDLKVIYQTCTAKRLYLVKKKDIFSSSKKPVTGEYENGK